MMNKQEIFDKVVKGLASQGWKRSIVNDNSIFSDQCLYRGTNGRKCAVGWLIPDELYVKELEYNNVYASVVQDVLRKIGIFDKTHFLGDLQDIHDNDNENTDLQMQFERFAAEHNLKMEI